MAKRDSDTDIRKLLPDLKTILKHADPAYSERIYREAMDNPELDAAVAARDRALAEMKAGATAGEGAPVDDASAAPEAVATRVGAPSPWAKAATGDAIDKSALPSASAPKADAAAAAPSVMSPIGGANADQAQPKARPALPTWVFPGIAAIALAPLAMWAVVSTLPPRHPLEVPGSAAASVQGTAPVTFDGGTAPSIQSAAPMPSAMPTASTDAPPAVTSAIPRAPALPPSQRQPTRKPRGAGDDPSGAATTPVPLKTAEPMPPKTAEPVAPVPPPPASSTPATPQSSSPDPFLDKKPPR